MIKIANEIYKELGPSHTESVYHRAMEAEFRNLGIKYESEVVTPIKYKGTYVGYGRADIVLPGILVIELKAKASALNHVEESRLQTYMKSLGINNGILINFPQYRYPQNKCSIRIHSI